MCRFLQQNAFHSPNFVTPAFIPKLYLAKDFYQDSSDLQTFRGKDTPENALLKSRDQYRNEVKKPERLSEFQKSDVLITKEYESEDMQEFESLPASTTVFGTSFGTSFMGRTWKHIQLDKICFVARVDNLYLTVDVQL